MKISYLVTCHNEYNEIIKLLEILLTNKRKEDEVVVLQDMGWSKMLVKPDRKKLYNYLSELSDENKIKFETYVLDNNFADFKNYGNSECAGDYIFQLDADEFITADTMELYRDLLEMNIDANLDLILVPRINTVEGLTQNHIQKWGWRVNSDGWINFPDYQRRLYRNSPNIRWINPVHEVIVGYDTFFRAPPDKEWCLYHPKSIEKQEQQNKMYSKIGEMK